MPIESEGKTLFARLRFIPGKRRVQGRFYRTLQLSALARQDNTRPQFIG